MAASSCEPTLTFPNSGEESMSGWRDSLGTDHITSDSLQLRLGELAEGLSGYVRLGEDDGCRLKTTACTKSWYELEGMIRTTCEYVREGVVRQKPSLKQTIKDAKSMLEEISLRVRVYDASMDCHESLFALYTSDSDLLRFQSRLRLCDGLHALEDVLEQVPTRFKAARRDLLQTHTALKEFDVSWKEDLLQRISHRPQWVPNEFSRQCSHCQRPFSLLRTKHHCRACGYIFCDACTTILESLPKLMHYIPQRVCQDCKERHAPWALRGQQHLQHHIIRIFPELEQHHADHVDGR